MSKIDIHVIASGTTPVNVELFSSEGAKISGTVIFSVTTFAQIGKAGFVFFLVLLGLLVLMGAIRTVRRGRSAYRLKNAGGVEGVAENVAGVDGVDESAGGVADE
jgi:hypothetical protein